MKIVKTIETSSSKNTRTTCKTHRRHIVEFDQVHRMGRRVHRKTRPIIAKFVQLKKRELVRKAAFTKLKDQTKYM